MSYKIDCSYYKAVEVDEKTRTVFLAREAFELVAGYDAESVKIHLEKDGYSLLIGKDSYIRIFTDGVSDEFDAYLDSLEESGFKFYFTDDKIADEMLELIEVE